MIYSSAGQRLPGRGVVSLTGALLALSALGGCGGGSDNGGANTRNLPVAVQQAVRTAAPVNPSLVTANNQFGFTIFDAVRGQNAAINIFISPTSLAVVMEILANGASGDTLTQMQQTLQLSGIGLPDLNSDNAALQASLVNPDPKVNLTIANSLWTRTGVIKPSFVQTNTTYYGSELGSTTGLPDNVNAWAAKKTNNLIPTILPPGDYSDTIAVVVNAIYFKGTWAQQFDKTQTRDAPFTLTDGTTVTVPTMQQTGTYDYAEGDHFQIARLPYGSKRMSMILLVPTEGTPLDTVLAQLSAKTLGAAIGQMHSMEGHVALPRFTASYGAKLNDTLVALGMKNAFDPGMADFSNLAQGAGGNVYLQFVYHKTFVKVNEEGTEAAAVTGGGVSVGSAPQLFQLNLNRPFFYAIRDDKTGVLLFLGKMMNPTAPTE